MAKKPSRAGARTRAAGSTRSAARTKGSAGRKSTRTTRRASKSGISLGGIQKAMQTFIERVDKSQRTEPHLLAARDRIFEMMQNMPRCRKSDDPECNVANPPPDCKFAPIPQ